MLKKLELGIMATIAFALVVGTTLHSMPVLAQGGNTTSNMTTTGGMVGATYGGVDIDSSTSTINCDGEVKGPVKTEGIQADAFVRHGTFAGNWNIVNEDKNGQDKGGTITGGWTDGSKYQINGSEQYDGICKAKVPKEITISGDCGTGVEIKYSTVEGQTDNFNGNARCYTS
jgi:hypothetical protein